MQIINCHGWESNPGTRLWWWRLGDLDPRLRGGSEWRAGFSRSAPGMSNTTGGRSARLTAAASGRQRLSPDKHPGGQFVDGSEKDLASDL